MTNTGRNLPGSAGRARSAPAALLLAPTAAGCPRAPGLTHGPAAVLPLLDVRQRDVVWLNTSHLPVSGVAAEVAAAAARAAAAGQAPLFVGGDHTVALGGVTGVARALRARARRSRKAAGTSRHLAETPLYLLWLDAHPDVNTPATSPSGNAHGMVLRALLEDGGFGVDEPLPPERVVLAGVRSFDLGELAFLQETPSLTLWDVERLRGDGWRVPLAALLRNVARDGGRLYVSLDLDVFDPTIAPGVVAPAPHGALANPVIELLRSVRRSGRLAGADVVELHPPSDDGSTAALAAQAVEALGLLEDHAAVAESGPRRPQRPATAA